VTTSHFPLPDVGEGLTEAEIVSWRVRPGEQVALNQVIVEIETAKSLVELPSPFAGTVDALLVDEGQTVEVGTPIIAVSSDAGAGSGAPAAPATAPVRTPVGDLAATGADDDRRAAAEPRADGDGATDPGDASADGAAPERQANLVGYGAGAHAPSRRRRPDGSAAQRQAAAPQPAAPRRLASVPATAAGVIAKPPIRKLAKDLEVDLTTVDGTGLAGEVTRDDVIRHAQQASVFRNLATPDAPSTREERIPVKGVRKAIAKAMVASAFTAPHVSIFTDVDATRTMEFVARLKNSPQFAGVRVSPLLIMAKAVMWAVRRNPTVNSTWTDEAIVVHNFVNLGIAAATPRGLIVPNIKDAQNLSLLDLSSALEGLTRTAREGKTQPDEMAHGTITITNLGSFGVDTGTPILNPGEVSIIVMGAIKQRPWVVDGELRVRQVTTVGASFDHRVVDGDVASRFIADIASVVEEPALLLD
jgi:2-oxoisovalerate dehydrogenase E2 component (dihydrolipoyl transacylase)